MVLQVDANLDVERVVKTVHNVAGYLPGTTDEYVVIGAHYDHLGLGEQFSLAPSLAGTIHPGADDNASGTAGVIELARWFATQPKQKRGILFLTFAGRGVGAAGLQLLRQPSRCCRTIRTCHDQHGHDRPRARRQGVHRRSGHRNDIEEVT
jgi:acetylornithine deacetylase/succinyl-diaminopimelate desuccinylase-like protein